MHSIDNLSLASPLLNPSESNLSVHGLLTHTLTQQQQKYKQNFHCENKKNCNKTYPHYVVFIFAY